MQSQQQEINTEAALLQHQDKAQRNTFLLHPLLLPGTGKSFSKILVALSLHWHLQNIA